MTSPPRTHTALLVALLGFAAAGCRRPPDGYYGTTVPRHPPDEVWVNNNGEPEWIDPGKTSDAVGGTIVFNTFAGLTAPHPKTLEPMPEIATRWDVSPDGRRYTFHLRASTWSDGHPLTAADFEYSWKRVLDPATASKYGSFLFPIENAEAFHQRALVLTGLPGGATADAIGAAFAPQARVERVKLDAGGRAFVWLAGAAGPEGPALRARAQAAVNGRAIAGAPVKVAVAGPEVVGVRATGPLTLEVRLEQPVPYFLSLVSYYTATPVPRHVMDRLRAEGKHPDLWTRPEHFVSNGPFVLAAWEFRRHMILRKNPRYWDASAVRLHKIRLEMIGDENTAMNVYKTGYIDSIGSHTNVPPEFLDHMRGHRDFQIAPQLAVYYYWFNTKAAPFDDARVRQAFSLAVDREALTKFVTRGGQIPSADFVPDGLAGYEARKSPLFDPERARRLLREAGYGPGGKRLPKVSLVYNTLEMHRLIAQAVQQMWRQHLGADVELENQEWKVYLKSLASHQFQVARAGWVGDYPDPYTFLELLSGASGNNHSNWKDPIYDRLLAEANVLLDPAARLAKLREAEARLLAEAPILPLYVYTRPKLEKPYLRGRWANLQDREFMKYWYVDERFYAGPPPELPPEDPPPPVRAPAPPEARP